VLTDRLLVEGDSVGHNSRVTDRTTLRERYSFVEPEERATGCLLLDDDGDVVDLFG